MDTIYAKNGHQSVSFLLFIYLEVYDLLRKKAPGLFRIQPMRPRQESHMKTIKTASKSAFVNRGQLYNKR